MSISTVMYVWWLVVIKWVSSDLYTFLFAGTLSLADDILKTMKESGCLDLDYML